MESNQAEASKVKECNVCAYCYASTSCIRISVTCGLFLIFYENEIKLNIFEFCVSSLLEELLIYSICLFILFEIKACLGDKHDILIIIFS